MGILGYRCPKCKGWLKRHCAAKACVWYLCQKDHDAWVLKVVKSPNQEPITLWDLRTYYPEPM